MEEKGKVRFWCTWKNYGLKGDPLSPILSNVVTMLSPPNYRRKEWTEFLNSQSGARAAPTNLSLSRKLPAHCTLGAESGHDLPAKQRSPSANRLGPEPFFACRRPVFRRYGPSPCPSSLTNRPEATTTSFSPAKNWIRGGTARLVQRSRQQPNTP